MFLLHEIRNVDRTAIAPAILHPYDLWAWNVVFVCNTESIFLCVSTSEAEPPPLLHITTLTTAHDPPAYLLEACTV